MAQTELSRRLTELLDATEYKRGNRDAFRALLMTKHQHEVGRSTLSAWLSGDRVPELGSLRVVLDALGVHGPERDEIVRLALPPGLLSPNRVDDVPMPEDISVPDYSIDEDLIPTDPPSAA